MYLLTKYSNISIIQNTEKEKEECRSNINKILNINKINKID